MCEQTVLQAWAHHLHQIASFIATCTHFTAGAILSLKETPSSLRQGYGGVMEYRYCDIRRTFPASLSARISGKYKQETCGRPVIDYACANCCTHGGSGSSSQSSSRNTSMQGSRHTIQMRKMWSTCISSQIMYGPQRMFVFKDQH